MSLIESLTSRIKSVQSKLEHYIDGRPTIQIMVEETLKIEGEKNEIIYSRNGRGLRNIF